MSGTNLMATQAALTGLATSSMTAASLTPLTLAIEAPAFYEPSGTSTRYVIAGTAMAALGTVLAGCSEPRPAPIANESALPPNQSQCTPTSRSPYCQTTGGVSVYDRAAERAQGHHADQALFGILAVVAVGTTIGGYFLGRRRGRKGAEKLAQQQAQVPQEPPTNQPNGTPKAENK